MNSMINKYVKYYNKNIVLFLLFFVSCVVHYYYGDFTKILTTYPDEIRYYEIAYDLYNGLNLSVNNIATEFQKIAYSVMISPLFAIENTIIRIKAINLLNSILISLSIFPIYYICKTLNGKNGLLVYIPIVIFIIFPETLITATFMPESLYWPLSITTIYLFMKNEENNSYLISILLGISCYFTYLCKEIFLGFVLCFVVYKFIIICCNFIIYKNSEKRIVYNLLIFLVTFLFMYGVIKYTLFYGYGNSYNQQNIDILNNEYNIYYIIYTVLFYISSILIASCILPIILPIENYGFLSKYDKKIMIFLYLFLLIMLLIIAFTISVREDLGLIGPRLHLRYLGPLLMVYYCIYFSYFTKLKTIKTNYAYIISVIIFIAMYFKKFKVGSAVDQYVLLLLNNKFSDIGELITNNGPLVVYKNSIIFCIVLFIIYTCLFYICKKSKKYYIVLFFAVIVLSNSINNYYARDFIYNAYSIDSKIANSAYKMKEYFNKKENIKKILFVVNSYGDKFKGSIDTYFDNKEKLISVQANTLRNIQTSSIQVQDYIFRDVMFAKQYKDINHIDYIILAKNVDLGLVMLNKAKEVHINGVTEYLVYENLESRHLNFAVLHKKIFYFDKYKYNAEYFSEFGISHPEEKFSWLNGYKSCFSLPLNCISNLNNIKIKINFYDSFNGEQRYSILNSESKLIVSGKNKNLFSVEFQIAPVNDELKFFIETPDAHSPQSVNINSDTRLLSFSISSIEINLNTN